MKIQEVIERHEQKAILEKWKAQEVVDKILDNPAEREAKDVYDLILMVLHNDGIEELSAMLNKFGFKIKEERRKKTTETG